MCIFRSQLRTQIINIDSVTLECELNLLYFKHVVLSFMIFTRYVKFHYIYTGCPPPPPKKKKKKKKKNPDSPCGPHLTKFTDTMRVTFYRSKKMTPNYPGFLIDRHFSKQWSDHNNDRAPHGTGKEQDISF